MEKNTQQASLYGHVTGHICLGDVHKLWVKKTSRNEHIGLLH